MCNKEQRLSKADLQRLVSQRERTNTLQTDKWLSSNGFNLNAFNCTHVKLLQAQKQANLILNEHQHLLTQEQRRTLENFKTIMANKRKREKLKPSAAFPILNISTKINRQLFKLARQRDRCTNTAESQQQ
jgi:hypothetical protein